MENKNNVYAGNQSVSPSVRQSLFKTLETVKKQVEYHAFGRLEKRGRGEREREILIVDPIYQELCLIIAEIYVMNPDTVIKINKEDTGLHIVQEVYQQLTNEHLQTVCGNFKEVTTKIFNKKSYFRTALYNAIFEHEAHYTNAVQSDYWK